MWQMDLVWILGFKNLPNEVEFYVVMINFKIKNKNIMRNRIILTLFVFVVFSLGLPFTIHAGYVNGYFKSNGTYVPGYYRSSPNTYKYDNYSYKAGSDLFNSSNSYPTKNYSSNWYTPSSVTQPDYYIGKSYYDLNTSYQTNQTFKQYSPAMFNTYRSPTYTSYPKYIPSTLNTNDYILNNSINYSRSVLGR